MNDKKRIVINKPAGKECDICKGKFSLYSFSGHIKHSHNLTSDEYAVKYGEFRKPKRLPTSRNIQKLICQLCNLQMPSVGMHTHLRDTHNITVDDYTKQFGEYRPSKLRHIEYAERLKTIKEEDKEICAICNANFASAIMLGYHIKNAHNLTKKKYVFTYIFNEIHPLCKCGCHRKVKLLSYYPYKVDYISGHNRPTLGFKFSLESKKKMSISAIKRIEQGIGKTTDTKPELEFKAILDKLGVQYIHPCTVDLGTRSASVDFYLSEIDLLVEIDGEYWHRDKIENLNFHILPNVISDKQCEVLDNMVRIRSLHLDKYKLLNTKDELFEFLLNYADINKVNDLKYCQKIMNKEYFKYCLKEKGKAYIKSYIWLLLKFVRHFQPNLPYPDLVENLQTIIYKLSKMNVDKNYNKETKEFSNNIFTIGHNYLKHHFKSYWKSRFNGNLSPEEAWQNDKMMKEVIEYRVGCNNNDEVFDFSLHQLARGLSARRISISFFKPLLACSIYFKYLGDKKTPIVLDPCCGFGGRLLGFKSKYPNGTYIGCEPNIETYNELLNLVKDANWTDVEIYNCKFEDFVNNKNYNFDLIFTSIPYYDREIYSNNVDYISFDHWKDTFIRSIERYGGNNNCYINVPMELSVQLGWNNIDSYIISNRSHFDKKEGVKKEVIVKL